MDKNFPRSSSRKQNIRPPTCLFMSCPARRKKVVCVLKSYTPRSDASVPGSPVPSERAPLTEHAMRLPHSSPALQRGEILIEWKDGTVTPLYEAWRSYWFLLVWLEVRLCKQALFLVPGYANNLLNRCEEQKGEKQKWILRLLSSQW